MNRRGFIRNLLGGVAAAAVVPQVVKAKPEKSLALWNGDDLTPYGLEVFGYAGLQYERQRKAQRIIRR